MRVLARSERLGGPIFRYPFVSFPVFLALSSEHSKARSIKHMMSGDLSSEVISTPWFPGEKMRKAMKRKEKELECT